MNLAAGFAHGDGVVYDAAPALGQRRELVVVGREERPRVDVFHQVLGDGPRQAQAVVGGRPAAYLVEEDKALRRRVVHDVGRLGHLDEEGGAAAREVVRGADAREDAVDEADGRAARGNERPRLRQKRYQRRLAEVG